MAAASAGDACAAAATGARAGADPPKAGAAGAAGPEDDAPAGAGAGAASPSAPGSGATPTAACRADDRPDEVNRSRLKVLFAGLTAENAAYVMKCLCLPDKKTGLATLVDHVPPVFRPLLTRSQGKLLGRTVARSPVAGRRCERQFGW